MSRFDPNRVFKFVDDLERRFEKLPEKLDDIWNKAVQLGWYPSPYMPAKLSQKSLSSQQAIDTRMLKAFEQNYDGIKQYVVVESKRREHILSVAIELHEQQNYIACIPLFLAQADGIFEEYLGLSAFTRHDGKLKRIASDLNSTFSNDSVAKAYFGQFKASSQFSGNSDNSDKAKGPNRNGILHGDSRHLDYGSYINSCKSICFLSSVMWLAEKYREKQT